MCVGLHAPVAYNGIANENYYCSSQVDACHHLSDDCHHDEDELDEAVEGYHFHPVFGSTRSAPSLDLENG